MTHLAAAWKDELMKAPSLHTHDELVALAARAEGIAAILHRGQADQNGDDTIDRLRRVASRFNPETEPFEHATAWLQEAIESCDIVMSDLLDAGIPAVVVDAVVLLTRLRGVSSDDYDRAIRRNPIALAVKLAGAADEP